MGGRPANTVEIVAAAPTPFLWSVDQRNRTFASTLSETPQALVRPSEGRMHVELLQTIPISGSIPERHFEVSAGSNAWAKFTDESGVEWVGGFGSGEGSRFHTVVRFADDGGRTVLVIAGGQGYVVDAASGDLIRRTPWHYSKAAIAIPERGFVVVADDTQIWATSRRDDRGAWRREPAWYDYGVGE